MQGLREVMATTWGRPLARSGEWERLRRRALAFAGLWTLLGGLVAALGFGTFVLDATVALLVLWAVAALVLGLSLVNVSERFRSARFPSVGGRVVPRGRQLGARLDELQLPRRLERLATRAGGWSRRGLASLGVRAAGAGTVGLAQAAIVSRQARAAAGRGGRRSAGTLRELGASIRTTGQSGGTTLSRLSARSSAPPVQQSQAARLNTLGAQLRREGHHERAAEQHRAALALVRGLDDKRAEALTLNNLALAVVHTEGLAASIRFFEQALVVLRELGDVEHEGRVIANLGFVHRSHGHGEEAEGLLHEALEKLPANSSAYRRVEEQLLRAS